MWIPLPRRRATAKNVGILLEAGQSHALAGSCCPGRMALKLTWVSAGLIWLDLAVDGATKPAAA